MMGSYFGEKCPGVKLTGVGSLRDGTISVWEMA